MINVKRNTPRDKSGNIIAVYYAYGEIDNSSSYNYNEEGINSEKVITDLRKLREDKNIKAVVLRVNSPGGSAYGSEQIWREVKLLKEEKPVIVSMGDYAKIRRLLYLVCRRLDCSRTNNLNRLDRHIRYGS